MRFEYPPRNFRFAFVILVILVQHFDGTGAYRANAKYDGYESVNLRRARSHQSENEYVSPEVLTSNTVDSGVLNDIGGAELGPSLDSVERKRRDRAGVDSHAHRAESDAIAAAAESAAAEADAVAAAVEASEVESANSDNRRGRQHFSGSSDYDNNAITFEEGDNGDNVVVVEKDLREGEHVGGGGHGRLEEHYQSGDSRAHRTSEFDVGGNQDAVAGSRLSHHGGSTFQAEGHSSSHSQRESGSRGGDSSMAISSSGVSSMGSSLNGFDAGDGSKGYADVQAPLNALLTESSDLAKEIRLVFQVLAKREDYLVQEMEKLKVALQNAIQVLQENMHETKLIRKRRDADDSNPYKACVYLNPPAPNAAANFAPPEALVQPQPPPPPDYEPGPDDSSPSGDEVDLSSVYWLKLPENEDEGILERVHRVLTGVRDSGKDVLLIPVTKGYMSREDVAKGFLRAVRINPAYTSSDAKQKKRRKKLRLRIRRI